ncbi:MAG: DegT/DnrJ/EryC1/StrS family aminotransferase [Nitrospiraceae bacterium]|nr:MAG: DegT/DnrJ/EryC1/StrS family aminotransferase [Nitrospiraceae bacterium]
MLDLKREYEYMKKDIDAAIGTCLDHQKWILGPEVKELEDKIAQYLHVRHCVGISSGTEALVLSLRALAIKLKGKEYWDRDDLIITTPFTFTATGDAILRAGATPVFVDIDPLTYNIDPESINEFIDSSRSGNIVGILPVHLYGQACEMDMIMETAKRNNLFVVEDVAQAFGGTCNGNKLGTMGATGCFSFFPSKNLGGFGDGGMISTNDDETASLVRMLLKHGGKDKYNVDHIGYNARLDTLQAAILLAKLKYIDEFNERRRRISGIYSQGLSDIHELILPAGDLPNHVFHQYTVRAPRRQEFQSFLKEKGISTMIYYPFPLHRMKVFEGRMKISGSLLNAERATDEVCSLPVEPLQSDEETEYVIRSVTQFSELISLTVQR